MSKRKQRVLIDEAINRKDELLSEFLNLAINRFKWKNLPEGLTSEILEELLISRGKLAGFLNENEKLTILPCYGTDEVNIYNQHTHYEIHGFNGNSWTKHIDEICLLKNNPTMSNDLDNLEIFAHRISEIEMTQDVNLFQQNTPKLLLVGKDGALTAKNIINKLRQFKMVIFAKENGLKNQVKTDDVLDTSSPFLLDKLGDYENFYRNKVLTYLCINNANTDKKERLITSEVESNNDLLELSLDLMYEHRKKFCNEVSKKFGIEIKVIKTEVKKDESIHVDNTTINKG